MAVTIEALLEENLGKVQELLQTSETLQSNLNEHLAPLDDTINGQVIPAVTSSLERMRTINEALPKLQQAFEQAEQEADTKLGDLDKQLDEVAQHVIKTEQSTEELLEQLETELKEIRRSVETHEVSMGEEFEKLESVTGDFTELIEARAKELTSAIDYSSTRVKTTFETIDKHKDRIVSQLGEIDEQRVSQVTNVTSSWDQAIASSKAKAEAALTQLGTKASTQLSKIANRYSEQLPTDMKNSAQTLVETIGTLGSGTKDAISKADQEVTSLSDIIDDVIEELESADSLVNNMIEKI